MLTVRNGQEHRARRRLQQAAKLGIVQVKRCASIALVYVVQELLGFFLVLVGLLLAALQYLQLGGLVERLSDGPGPLADRLLGRIQRIQANPFRSLVKQDAPQLHGGGGIDLVEAQRSEERRVGKERRSPPEPY